MASKAALISCPDIWVSSGIDQHTSTQIKTRETHCTGSRFTKIDQEGFTDIVVKAHIVLRNIVVVETNAFMVGATASNRMEVEECASSGDHGFVNHFLALLAVAFGSPEFCRIRELLARRGQSDEPLGLDLVAGILVTPARDELKSLGSKLGISQKPSHEQPAYLAGVLDLSVTVEVRLRKIALVWTVYHRICESPSALCTKFLQVKLHIIELDRDFVCRGQLRR